MVPEITDNITPTETEKYDKVTNPVPESSVSLKRPVNEETDSEEDGMHSEDVIKSFKAASVTTVDDDDEITILEPDNASVKPPPSKKPKLATDVNDTIKLDSDNNERDDDAENKADMAKPQTEDIKTSEGVPSKDAFIASYEELLTKIQGHVMGEVDKGHALGRKMMDVMLAAINKEVLTSPHAVRKLILDKKLVLPNTITEPPSQVVDLLIEHDSEHSFSRVLKTLFGDEKPKETENDRLDKARYRRSCEAPCMSRLVGQIGLDLCLEFTYGDIVCSKNLPDMPSDIESYKKVANQLRPVWKQLKEKNKVYKTTQRTCRMCGFKTDSAILFSEHIKRLHYNGRWYSCTMCPQKEVNNSRIKRHYRDKHGLVPLPADEHKPSIECPLCDLNFQFKGQLAAHVKECKKAFLPTQRQLFTAKTDDKMAINQWMWDVPAIEPAVSKQPKPQPHKSSRAPAPTPTSLSTASRAPPSHPLPAPAPSLHRSTGISGPSTSASAVQRNNIDSLMPVLVSLYSNPQAIEKLKQNNPEMMQHVTNQFNIVRKDPILFAQLQQKLASFKATQQKITAPVNTPKLTTTIAPPRLTTAPPNRGGRPSLGGLGAGQSTFSSSQNTTALAGVTGSASGIARHHTPLQICEICDTSMINRSEHFKSFHKQVKIRNASNEEGAPLACSRCSQRFWSYEGLERHLVFQHGLVTQEFLRKAQNKLDNGVCKICKKAFAFNLLSHLAAEHGKKLCSAEIRYNCDLCNFSCVNYPELDEHLSSLHPNSTRR